MFMHASHEDRFSMNISQTILKRIGVVSGHFKVQQVPGRVGINLDAHRFSIRKPNGCYLEAVILGNDPLILVEVSDDGIKSKVQGKHLAIGGVVKYDGSIISNPDKANFNGHFKEGYGRMGGGE